MAAMLVACLGFVLLQASQPPPQPQRRIVANAMPMASADGVKGYFASKDVMLLKRSEDSVAAFHEKERHRWDVVYDEDYFERYPGGMDLEFYPGDRVEIVTDVKVKHLENAKGMRGTVTHYEFDDGYESCQTCSTSCPVTVVLDTDM